MRSANAKKPRAILISTISVSALWGPTAWPSASNALWDHGLRSPWRDDDNRLPACFCRWLTYLREHRENLRREGLDRPLFP